jgi:hypothetical protein
VTGGGFLVSLEHEHLSLERAVTRTGGVTVRAVEQGASGMLGPLRRLRGGQSGKAGGAVEGLALCTRHRCQERSLGDHHKVASLGERCRWALAPGACSKVLRAAVEPVEGGWRALHGREQQRPGQRASEGEKAAPIHIAARVIAPYVSPQAQSEGGGRLRRGYPR